jgi:penicillin V acylase-like amidase (Ntn superfamily)
MPDGIENDQACIDREIDLEEIGEPPHHALQDARLLAVLVEPRHGQLDIS